MTTPAVIVEPSPDTPLVWFDVSIGGGAALDPTGVEGLHRHAALLARRGAAGRDRTAMDDALDAMGAMLDVGTSRDTIRMSGLVLSRHLDAVIELAAEILAEPRFAEDEHARLLRETPQALDEIRDDDDELSQRYFDWLCSPGHPYGRTALGTEASIKRIDRASVVELWKREVVADNLIIGLAGDIDDSIAARCVTRLTERLPRGGAGRQTIRDTSVQAPAGRRLIVVDKAERTQAHLRIGHQSIRYGHPDTAAFTVAEAIFGGLFSSRLMQEIRVKRGWSYGIGCALRRARLPHWFEIHTAAGIEVADQALSLTLDMLADYAAHGPTDEEVDFAKSYLVGAMPFNVATARQRMQIAVRDAVFDLPPGYSVRIPELLAQLTAPDIRAACAKHLRPADVATIAVTTAETAAAALAAANAGPLKVLKHDEY